MTKEANPDCHLADTLTLTLTLTLNMTVKGLILCVVSSMFPACFHACFRACAPPGQVLVLVEVLEEGGLTHELLLLAHLLAGASWLGQPDLQGAERGPHHLSVAEVLEETRRKHVWTPAAVEGLRIMSW